MPTTDIIIVSAIIIAGILGSVLFKKLTITAAVTGGAIAYLLFFSAGYTGVVMLAAFFILGSAATSFKLQLKQQQHLAEENKGKRSVMQVFANAGVAGMLAVLILLQPAYKETLQLMIAASFASALSDTFSSELGNVYGKKFYNISTLKKDTRGLNGVVSMEGLFFGICGSIIIATIAKIGFNYGLKELLIIAVAGLTGNVSDSIIGAVAERKKIIGNNTVNMLNTAIAAVAAAAILQM
ncbi:DUF92 domain-containing protein [Panacibacter sp. DH6]|uniref:DUF92 domain-containing protein n=1 Tax=Panacibacter microcysteis TaxID=2793269 RepID=A0A931E4T0_9BACT|nr:DUF92 domain-containing protein [Panacibacter microcysteis]MBG9375154.1 DUF92 domain-containing protein [Panacibacter microcysteis]